MATKPLTSEAIALTEKKMDMTLDDIIKMSKSNTTKPKMQRVSNRSQSFLNNAAQEKSTRVQRFVETRSSLRRVVLAQRRSSYQGNQFPLATEAARKAAIGPIRNRAFKRSRGFNMNKLRFGATPFQKRAPNGSFTAKQPQPQPQPKPQPRPQVNATAYHKPQTLDSLFANMKEQRMRALSQQSNGGRRKGGGGSGGRERRQWGRGWFGN